MAAAAVVAACAATALAALSTIAPSKIAPPPALSGWAAFPGRTWTDSQCQDIQNVVNQTASSCAEVCDSTARCTAINAFSRSERGPCALRACACGYGQPPAGTNADFTAYRRDDGRACPPSFASVLGDSMVLQRAPLPARVFGTAAPNTLVAVTVTADAAIRQKTGRGSAQKRGGFRAEGAAVVASCNATVDAGGQWACVLPPTPAGGPFAVSMAALEPEPRASGRRATPGQVLRDVWFGDVIVCSGQSNMFETVQLVNNATAEVAAASGFPWIRIAVVGTASADTPQRDATLVLPWQKPSPAAFPNGSWTSFSATCWFTARELSAALGPSVPLGLVDAAVGGTPIEKWTPGLPGEAGLYNAMVAPLTGFVVKTILWYQGENNSFKPTKWIDYASQFPAMIRLWRQAWADGTGVASLATVPFGFVQIGPRDCVPCADHQGPTGTFYGGVRWSQTGFRYAVPNDAMPGTFMAVAADLAEGYAPVLPIAAGCVHYGDKQSVGRRLALGVRRAVYGHDVVSAGPMVVGVTVNATSVVVRFRPEGGPIEVRNASGFELSLDGAAYIGAPIVAHDVTSVTLAVPKELRDLSSAAVPVMRPSDAPRKVGGGGLDNDGGGGDFSASSSEGVDGSGPADGVVSMRYIMHDTPCINRTCAVYGAESQLPSPPLVANLPGHEGADPVGWNMTASPAG